MKKYTVAFTPEAEEQLAELYGYIAERTSSATALRFTSAIVDYCDTLQDFPHRGTQRDDVRPGLRISHYKRNTAIAFAVDDASAEVTIIGIFYGGRNYLALLAP